MEQYFIDVIKDLSLDDMKLLGALHDQEATAGFKSLNNCEALIASGLSQATYRKVFYRLAANKFITTVTQKRQHSIYITQYGIVALQITLKGVGG
jgi:hypothetical protein